MQKSFNFGRARGHYKSNHVPSIRRYYSEELDIIVEEFENEVVARVSDGEILGKDLEKTIVLTQLIRSVQLEKFPEGFQLHVKEVRIRHRIVYRSEIDSIVNYLGHSKIVYYELILYRVTRSEPNRAEPGVSRQGEEAPQGRFFAHRRKKVKNPLPEDS